MLSITAAILIPLYGRCLAKRWFVRGKQGWLFLDVGFSAIGAE
jgi:hypothetical protein